MNRSHDKRHEASLAEAGSPRPAVGQDDDWFSARTGLTGGQKLFVSLLVLAMVAALSGVQMAALCLMVGLGLIVLGACLLRLAATLVSPRPGADEPVLCDAELPVYSVLVPLYREGRVLPQLLAALRAIDYPPALLEVKLLLEADDTATQIALGRLDLPAFCERVIVPPGLPRTKPRALSFALAGLRGRLVTVFDAEDLPDRQQLRLAASVFARQPGIDVLQARLAIHNAADGWLAALFAVEYAVLFDVLNPGIARLRLPLLLGGTSNHFRIDVLRAVGGWDPWNVTEDADLGLRLARHGRQVATLDSTTWEEAPADPEGWLRQRRRWMKGWIQTLGVHSREPMRVWRELGPLRGLASLLVLANGLAMPLFGLAASLFFVDDLLSGALLSAEAGTAVAVRSLWLVNTVLGVASLVWPIVLACRRRTLRPGLRAMVWLPLRWLLLTVAAWTGIIDLVRRPHYWGTTAHGRLNSGQVPPG